MIGVAAIGLGGAIGATLRWFVAETVPVPSEGFPLGITVVSVLGSFALGLLVGLEAPSVAFIDTATVTAGILGGFTTFSTWMVDIDLADSRTRTAVVVAVPLTLGLLAAGIGVYVGGAAGL